MSDIFLRDLVAGTTMLVSATTNGSFANGASTDPVITPDGTRVVFFSSAKNLVPGVSASSKGEIYLRDLVAGTTVWTSTNAANDVNNDRDVFIADLQNRAAS